MSDWTTPPAVGATELERMMRESDRRLRLAEQGTAWINITFNAIYGNYGSGWQTCQYRKVNGMVELHGLMIVGGLGAAVPSVGGTEPFTLPVGYRPAGHHMWNVIANNGWARVDINNSGIFSVQVYSGGGTLPNGAFIQLDGIRFAAAA